MEVGGGCGGTTPRQPPRTSTDLDNLHRSSRAPPNNTGAEALLLADIQDVRSVLGEEARIKEAPQFCDACFSGDYPTRLQDLDEGTVASQLSLLEEVS